MAYTIESDKSRRVKWVVRKDTDVSLTITVTLASVAYNLSGYTFVCEIFKIGGTTPILTLTQGYGITNNGAAGTLVLAITDTQLNLTPDEYFWKLRTTAPTDNLWFNGIFDVKGYLHDSSEDNSVSVALTIGGDSVDVALTLGADSINGSGTANQIAYWSDTDTVAALTTATYPSLTELSYVKGVTSAVQTQFGLKQNLVNSATALVDGATIDLTAIKHTLSCSVGRTFTISYTGDDITLIITLAATSGTFTFPATTLCVTNGTASGDNTMAFTGGVSGDKLVIAVKKVGSDYYAVGKNFGQ